MTQSLEHNAASLSLSVSPIEPGAAQAIRRRLQDRPHEPWIPKKFHVFPLKPATTTRVRGKVVPCWDVRYRADGWDYQRRFRKPLGSSEQAQVWARGLSAGFAKGWAFDPMSRRFLDPEERASSAAKLMLQPADDLPTVVTAAVEYLRRRWSKWSPSSRQAAVRALKRACVHLLRDGAPESPLDLFRYLDAMLRPARDAVLPAPGDEAEHDVPDQHRLAHAYFTAWSLPLADLTWKRLEDLITTHERSERFPGRMVKPTTRQRFEADLCQFVSTETIRAGLADPWPALIQVTRGARKQAARVVPVDADLVLSPAEICLLANACVEKGSWGEVVRCFVLVMGFCGLRPGEAMGLRICDLDLPEGIGSGKLRIGRSRRKVGERWLDPEEDREWGPLKGKSKHDSRSVPIPMSVVAALQHHLATLCGGFQPSDPLFQHKGRPFDLSMFADEVWVPARAAIFPADPALSPDDPAQSKRSKLRRHDLRHAACSMWLNSGVDFKVCQRWSGHSTLSVFLDVYQGILPGREDEGVAAMEAWLADRAS